MHFGQILIITLTQIFSLSCHENGKETIPTTPYRFTPTSRNIDTEPEMHYKIFFEENEPQTKFTQCYYHSEVRSGNYTIIQGANEQSPVVPAEYSESEFETFQALEKCGLSTKQYAPNWTIKAYDEPSNLNYTEMVNVFYKIQVYIKELHLLTDSSFVNFLNLGDVAIKHCALIFEHYQLGLDIRTRTVTHQLYQSHPYGNRIESLGDGYCGFRISNVLINDPKHFTLVATDWNGTKFRDSFSASIYDKSKLMKNMVLTAVLGNAVTIVCGRSLESGVDLDQEFCKLYNPQGRLIITQKICAYTIDIVSYEDFGTWSCKIGHKYSMATSDYQTVLREIEKETIDTWSTDGPTEYSFGCKLINFNNPKIDACSFSRPDGNLFVVQHSSAATPTYTAKKTNLDKGICGLEIQKPLVSEDKGSWKCEAEKPGHSIGVFINVMRGSTLYFNEPRASAFLTDPFQIICMIPFPAERCHILSPNGTQFPPDNPSQTKLGECRLRINSAVTQDNGTWLCSFDRGNGLPDMTVKHEVRVVTFAAVKKSPVVVNEGERADLFCNSGGVPISYCHFQQPNAGVTYSLNLQTHNSPELKYTGRGLKYGHCGITIMKANRSHIGRWKCQLGYGVSVKGKTTDSQTEWIDLEVIITYWGLSLKSFTICIIVACLILIMSFCVGLRTYIKRLYDHLMELTRREPNVQFRSNESGTGRDTDNLVEGIDLTSVASSPMAGTSYQSGSKLDGPLPGPSADPMLELSVIETTQEPLLEPLAQCLPEVGFSLTGKGKGKGKKGKKKQQPETVEVEEHQL